MILVNRGIERFLFREFTAVACLKPLNGSKITDIGFFRPNSHSHQDVIEIFFRIDTIELTGAIIE